MSFLLGLITSLFKGWLGFKQNSAISQGEAEQKLDDANATIALVEQKEAIHENNSALSDAALDDKLRG